ncbi:hypothetical protein V8C86DRAFT_2868935 [Haematococcus lacustris]
MAPHDWLLCPDAGWASSAPATASACPSLPPVQRGETWRRRQPQLPAAGVLNLAVPSLLPLAAWPAAWWTLAPEQWEGVEVREGSRSSASAPSTARLSPGGCEDKAVGWVGAERLLAGGCPGRLMPVVARGCGLASTALAPWGPDTGQRRKSRIALSSAATATIAAHGTQLYPSQACTARQACSIGITVQPTTHHLHAACYYACGIAEVAAEARVTLSLCCGLVYERQFPQPFDVTSMANR